MTRRRKHTLGMTLIEMLAYVVVSAAVLNICAVTFVQTSRLAALSSERALRQQAFAQFSDDFVRTVHGATRVLPNAGGAVTHGDQLVLDTPNGPAVVGMAGGKPAIWQLEPYDGAWRIRRITAYPIGASIRFGFDTAEATRARRVTLEVIGPPRKEPSDNANRRTVVAALRVWGAQT